MVAVKEAAIPAIIGIAVIITAQTRKPLIKTLLYNPKILDVDKIKKELEERGNDKEFDSRLMTSTYLLAGTFFFSAMMNYILSKWIVTSPSGSSAFNEELGQMTLYSYPMIAIPTMLMMMAILYYLSQTINKLTGFTFTEVLRVDDEVIIPAIKQVSDSDK